MSFYEVKELTDRRRSNRYRLCNLLTDLETGEPVLSSREVKEITVANTDVVHTVTVNECNRLDLLAHKYYNNALLWWVIAQANNIYDPFAYLAPGTRLRIPTIENLYLDGGVLS